MLTWFWRSLVIKWQDTVDVANQTDFYDTFSSKFEQTKPPVFVLNIQKVNCLVLVTHFK